ncbi:PilZ domain-containing protein [Novosphingobium acidiphilum]|jgi:hypothetical protein|uniref:PilZ domain-containing protein n=1 Tax=Novosphingobium acidiphilum TaxID=505248 RepID=UPI0003FAC4AB|nr:PilZ domain-containing protein [Novosphingobium acidiphilum]
MERKRNIQPAAERRRAEAELRRQLAAVLPPEPERRANPRLEAIAAQSTETVRLVDLSTHGCCLGFTATADYRPGQFIRLGFPGEAEAIRAIVRWTEGQRVGAEFTRGLPSDRIDAILGEERHPMVGLL